MRDRLACLTQEVTDALIQLDISVSSSFCRSFILRADLTFLHNGLVCSKATCSLGTTTVQVLMQPPADSAAQDLHILIPNEARTWQDDELEKDGISDDCYHCRGNNRNEAYATFLKRWIKSQSQIARNAHDTT